MGEELSMTELPYSDDEIVRTLYSPVLSDTLDAMGYRNQAMRPFVRPLDESLVLFGRARTGRYTPVDYIDPKKNPYEIEIALIDDLGKGDVAVLGALGPTDRIAPWGELLTTASRSRGAAGCVTDGLVRDTRLIRSLKFPVFHGGIGPLDSKGRGEMVERDAPVECGGVLVAPGDFVFGDVDGVVVLPRAVAAQALSKAMDKVNAENTTRDELRAGRSLRQVYEKYGVL
jgi:4-hydroxy-4-methyl-2-oxoglutarate aldolase